MPVAARLLGVATLFAAAGLFPAHPAAAQANPLWTQEKVRNYLPHMTVPEVRAFLARSDMVLIPVAALEQHGNHLPIGTDYLNGVEQAKLIAQRADVLVAPILLPGQSPYHMGFEGTITLPSTLIQEVYVEAVKSLIAHGFKRFLMLNAHGGNRAITTFIVDRINQETAGVAVDLGAVSARFRDRERMASVPVPPPDRLDRHGGTPETSSSLYLTPTLVDLEAAVPAEVAMPDHLEAMLPYVLAGDPTALAVFLAEGLKDESTGKGTSSAEMSSTGVWGTRDPAEATLERGRVATEIMVDAAVAFIERWNELRPPGRLVQTLGAGARQPHGVHALVQPEPIPAGEDHEDPVQPEVGQRGMHGPRHPGGAGALELHADPATLAEDEQVDLGTAVRRPEIAVLPVDREKPNGLPHREPLPRGTALGMAKKGGAGIEGEQRVQQPGIGQVYLGGLDLPFPEVLKPRHQPSHHEGVDHRVEVGVGGRRAHTHRARDLGRVPVVPVMVRHHHPETPHRRRRHADAELRQVALEKRADEGLPPLRRVPFAVREEGARETAAQPEPVDEFRARILHPERRQLVVGDAAGEGFG